MPGMRPIAQPQHHDSRVAHPGHTGRRPGDSGTHDAILLAARFEFGESGYDGATIRAIAARAEVDPALEQVVERFLTVWEEPHNRPIFMALLRSVISNEQAAGLVRRLLVKEVFGPLAVALGVPDAELRATLAGSQFIGLALMRYVGRVEPLASTDVPTVAVAVGPTIQRYLTGEIG